MGAVKIRTNGQSVTLTAVYDMTKEEAGTAYSNAALSTPITLSYAVPDGVTIYLGKGDKKLTLVVAGGDTYNERVQVQEDRPQLVDIPLESNTALRTELPQSAITGLTASLANAGRTARPGDNNMLSWSYDPVAATNSTVSTGGVVYLVKLPIPEATTVTKLYWVVSTVGVTPTASQNHVGIYNSSGTRLVTAGVDADVTAGGIRTTTLASTALPAGFVYAAFLFNAGTPPALSRANSGSSIPVNTGLTAAAFRFAQNSTGQTTLPASLTLASSTAGITYWAGIGA